MAYPTAAMESGLIAIALVIRSRDGPRFVFHYPPHPDTKTSQRKGLYGTELDESDSEDDTLPADNSDLDDGNFLAHKADKLDLSDSVVTESKDHVEAAEEDCLKGNFEIDLTGTDLKITVWNSVVERKAWFSIATKAQVQT